MTNTKRPNQKSRLVWRIFVLATVGVYFFALGAPLLGPDEPRYSQVAREMFERRDWVTPTLGGFHWFEKPALLYWLQIVFYNLFGVSEFAARFGSALFGLGTIAGLWILGKSLATEGTENTEKKSKGEESNDKGRRTKDNLANWLFIVSATSLGLLAFARGASFDIILTFPMTASLVAFFVYDSGQRRQKARTAGERKSSPLFTFHFSLFAFYFFVGVALLAKGLVGMVFPFAIVAFYFVLSRRFPSKAFIFSLFWGTALSVAVAALWYLPMYARHGWEFIDEFIIQHHFARFATKKYQHVQPFWFFWAVLPLMTLPWLPFFFAAIWNFFKETFRQRDTEADSRLPIANRHLRLFAFAWLLVPLVFFSFSGSKLPGYILPALPAAVILTAEYISRFAKNGRRETILKTLAFAMLAAVFLTLAFFLAPYSRHETVKNLVETANENGYAGAPVLQYRTVVHNAEFYAAGRLVRLADGKQKEFSTGREIAEEIRRTGSPALVLVTRRRVPELTESEILSARVLGDNGKLAILAVTLK